MIVPHLVVVAGMRGCGVIGKNDIRIGYNGRHFSHWGKTRVECHFGQSGPKGGILEAKIGRVDRRNPSRKGQ